MPVITLSLAKEKLLNHLIVKQSFLNHYPKKNVIFVAMDSILQDAQSRKILSDMVSTVVQPLSFDCVAGIASRGYLFSSMIAEQSLNQSNPKGEQLIQKVKVKDNSNFIQMGTTTEYSSDNLQILAGTIQHGKNYLIADDLCATGGSVITAIQLIRKGGGHVQKVFVMTELMDLGAREKLRKMDVELVSLFQFTQRDLEQLLVLQKASQTKPIEYQLSHYRGKVTPAITVHIASNAAVKKAAIQQTIQDVFHPSAMRIVGHDAPSGISNQPLGYEETAKGAANRLNTIRKEVKEDKNTLLVSIENGVRYSKEEKSYYDFVHVMLEKEGTLYQATKDCCPIPNELMDQVFLQENMTWGELAKKAKLAASNSDPHREIIFGGVPREVHIYQACMQALAQPIPRMIYLKEMNHSAQDQPINLYNHGCSTQWHIDEKETKKNDFKLFSTGDAFSILSPQVDVQGKPVNIHVGIDPQQKFNRSTLLHEALQMCRTVREQGAESITVALPELYHSEVHPSQFNTLLKDLFESQGVDRLYFYDKNYQGKMEIPSADILLFEKTPPVHIVLCCSSNKAFAEELAKCLKMRGENVELHVIQGSGEQAKIPFDLKLPNATVTLVQSTRPNPDDMVNASAYDTNGASSYFFEAMTIARQARLRGAKQINLVNPYQFGARSDKSEDNHNGKAGAYVQQNGALLEAAGVNHVVTAECHDQHTLSGSYMRKGMTSSAVPALTLISTIIAKQWQKSPHAGKFRLVEPDAGAAKRTKELAQSLQPILGDQLHKSRIVGDKERGSHKDDSAQLNQLNSGSISIYAKDKYLITDDETATGSTLCQAIQSLKKQGAEDISVIVVHNNMPLDWLTRQLCLARFLFLGVNDLHFSNTQEMGLLAQSYEDLVHTHACHTSKSRLEVEKEIGCWFEKNLPNSSLEEFKNTFNQLSQRVFVHSLAGAFADKLTHNQKPSVFARNSLFSPSDQREVRQPSQWVIPEHKHDLLLKSRM